MLTSVVEGRLPNARSQWLFTIIEQLLADTVAFVRIDDRLGEWVETTLQPSSIQPTLLPGQTATIRSWSGRFDRQAG